MREPRIAVKHERALAIDPPHGMRYARGVNHTRRIELPSPEHDRVHAGKLFLAVALGLALGIATAAVIAMTSPPKAVVERARSFGAPPASSEIASARVEPARVEPARTTSERQTPATTASSTKPVALPKAALDAGAAPDASAAGDTSTARDASTPLDTSMARDASTPLDTSMARDASTARARAIEPGRIAYVVCEGLPPVRGPYPCPRDAELEQRVLAVARTLPACEHARALPAGTLDLRLEVRAAGTVEAVAIKAASPQAEDAVRTCVDAPLRELRSALRPTKMIVSFRFELR